MLCVFRVCDFDLRVVVFEWLSVWLFLECVLCVAFCVVCSGCVVPVVCVCDCDLRVVLEFVCVCVCVCVCVWLS